MNKDPKKPITVPENAVWNPSENEWELGEKNESGINIGEWKWWLAPNGHLCCHTFYEGESGNDFSFKRFHPDGTPSREGKYKNGREEGTITFTKSENQTSEYFGLPLTEQYEHIWKAEITYDNGTVIDEKYFDKDGIRIELNYYIKQDIEEEADETDEETVPVTFDTVEEASERWIKEGKEYKDGINDWLDIIYIHGKQPTEAEPTETRKDMAPYVLKIIEELNEKKDYQKLRELFPPDYDPFTKEFDKNFTNCVSKVMLLPDMRILAKVGQYYEDTQECYLINDDQFEKINDLISFGHSHDKRFYAKAYTDRIDITETWDGKTTATINYPNSYGEEFSKLHADTRVNKEDFNGNTIGIESIHVFNDGKKVLLCSHAGIFILETDRSQLIHPMITPISEVEDPWYLWGKNSEETEDGFMFNLDYPHADLSPDNKYIACGSQDSLHLILTEEKGKWEQTGEIEQRSSYPHYAKFNYLIEDNEGKPYHQVALSSCHFSESATISLPLRNLTKDFKASGYEGDDSLEYIDERNWIYSILPFPNAYMLGANNGYIWFMGAGGVQTLGYIHIGGTIMSMDMSEDRKTIVVASYSGQIVLLKNEYNAEKDGEYSWKKNNRKDPYLITSLPHVDRRRYLFWKGKKPMIW